MSKIEWTEATWNPTTGCTKISPGCKYCYAETMSARLKAMGSEKYRRGFKLAIHPKALDAPRRIKKPTLFFVNSMSDLFHEDMPDSAIRAVIGVIEETPRHTYQLLTKRSLHMLAHFRSRLAPPPPNLWLGVSVENKEHGLPRIENLRAIEGAAVRFLSCEPLLEDLGDMDLTGVDWCIVGGESGPKARRMMPEWAHNIRRQCDRDGVAFFFKQWGRHGEDGLPVSPSRRKEDKLAGGAMLTGKRYTAMPKPAAPAQ